MTARFENMPPRIAKLPVDERGYPILYFVETVDGKPDFRMMNMQHLRKAMTYGRCWTCGEHRGQCPQGAAAGDAQQERPLSLL